MNDAFSVRLISALVAMLAPACEGAPRFGGAERLVETAAIVARGEQLGARVSASMQRISIRFSGVSVGPQELESLVRLSGFRWVSDLFIRDAPLDDEICRVLAEHDHAPFELEGGVRVAGLEWLDLSVTGISDACIRHLVRTPRISPRLALAGNRLTPEGVRALVDAPAFAGVEALRLSRNPLGDDGARAIAESRHLARLRELELGRAGIGDAGMVALLSSPGLENLELLDLQGNRIATEEPLRLLLDARHLPALLTLDACDTSIPVTPATQAELARARPNLRILYCPEAHRSPEQPGGAVSD